MWAVYFLCNDLDNHNIIFCRCCYYCYVVLLCRYCCCCYASRYPMYGGSFSPCMKWEQTYIWIQDTFYCALSNQRFCGQWDWRQPPFDVVGEMIMQNGNLFHNLVDPTLSQSWWSYSFTFLVILLFFCLTKHGCFPHIWQACIGPLAKILW